MVSGFRNRDFQELNDLLAKNEHLENSFFQTVVQMSRLHYEVSRNTTSQGTIQKALNKRSEFLSNLCEEDKVPAMSKITVDIREFGVIKLGQPRQNVKEEACVEASYD